MENKILEKRIDELCELFLKLKTKEDCKMLLEDLCTFKEVEQMALRAYAAKLFLSGKTYAEITQLSELSSATISRVSRSISHGSGGYKSFIEVKGNEDEK